MSVKGKIKRFMPFLSLAAVFCVAAGAGAFFRFEFASPDKTCTLCHEIRASRDKWANSAHKEVNCKECHGGTLEELSDNVNRVVQHFKGADYTKLDSVFCLSERQVEKVSARCANCHRAEAAQWAASGHGKPASVFIQDKDHNAAWKPADSCLRCHGMFLEGDIEDNVARKDLATRSAVPCLACHKMHDADTLQFYSRNERIGIPAAILQMQNIVTADGRPVKRSKDASNRLCVTCHAANAEGIAGSSDDRTPLGAQEGMSCTDCHKGHGRKADASRGRCPHKNSQTVKLAH